jgi:hypothetical protein
MAWDGQHGKHTAEALEHPEGRPGVLPVDDASIGANHSQGSRSLDNPDWRTNALVHWSIAITAPARISKYT